MQHLEVSGAVRHIYIYVIRRIKVNSFLFRGERPDYQFNGMGGLPRQWGRFEITQTSCSLPDIDPRFLIRPALGLVTTSTELS